jgi:hypothetical protein
VKPKLPKSSPTKLCCYLIVSALCNRSNMATSTVTIDHAYFETLLRRYITPLSATPDSCILHLQNLGVLCRVLRRRANLLPHKSGLNLYVPSSSQVHIHPNGVLQHSGGVDYSTPIHLPTVTILKQDHDSLVRKFPYMQCGIY